MRKQAILPILLLFAACYHHEDDLTAPLSALMVSASATSIPADGFSTIDVRAQLDDRTRTTDRTVVFTTTAGTFIGAASPGNTLTLTADSSGVAVASLRSSTNIESANITVKAGASGSVGQFVTVNFTSVKPSDVITLAPVQTAVPADGATVTQIAATVAPQLPSALRSVTFTTSIGTFTNNTTQVAVTVSSTNRAVADLKAPSTPGLARLTASVGGVTAEALLNFVPALPDTMTLDVGKLSMKSSEEVTVTAMLLRVPGTVTAGRSITYTATDASGKAVGLFRNALVSNAAGTATVVFSANGAAPALVTIHASTPGNASTINSDVTIRIDS